MAQELFDPAVQLEADQLRAANLCRRGRRFLRAVARQGGVFGV